MAGSSRKDHHAIGYFRVELDGIDSGSFRKCSGLKTETEVFEYQEGGDNEATHKLMGPTKASNIVLTKGFVSTPRCSSGATRSRRAAPRPSSGATAPSSRSRPTARPRSAA